MRKLLRILTAPFRWLFRLFNRIGLSISSRIHRFREFFTEVPQDHPLGDSFQQVMESPRDLLPHLDALRKHLLRALLFMAMTTAISFAFSSQILAWLAQPLEGGVESLMAIEVTEPLSTLMRISLLTGFALALPYLVFEVWLFIAPALSTKARIWGLLAIPAVLFFFLGGIAFTYYVILPTAIPFLLNILGLPTQIRPASYISFTTGIMFWIGISFEFPLVIFMLASLGWITYKTLIQQWRLAVVIIAVISALITPTIDPVNMSLVMLPLVLLYILSIFLAYLANGRQRSPEPGATV